MIQQRARGSCDCINVWTLWWCNTTIYTTKSINHKVILERTLNKELMNIILLLTEPCSGNLNVYKKMNSGYAIQLNNYFWDVFESWLFLKSDFFSQTLFFNLHTLFLVSGSQSYFDFILLFFSANKSFTSETSRPISIWTDKRVICLT